MKVVPKRWGSALAAVLMLALMTKPVLAIQTGIRLGVFQPQADTREDTEFSVGLDFLIYRWSRSNLSLSANWLTIRERSGSENNLYPIFLNLKHKLRDYSNSYLYLGAGAGVYFPDGDIPTMGLKSEVKGAWNSIFGVEFTGPKYMSSFIEGGYMASKDPGKSGMWHLEWGIRY
jgi:hypothetical protein